MSLSPSLAHEAPSREVAPWGSPGRAPSPWLQGATGRQPWPRMAALGGTRPPRTFAPCHRACSWQELGTEGRDQGSSRTPRAATSRNSVTDGKHTQPNSTQSMARSLTAFEPQFLPLPPPQALQPGTPKPLHKGVPCPLCIPCPPCTTCCLPWWQGDVEQRGSEQQATSSQRGERPQWPERCRAAIHLWGSCRSRHPWRTDPQPSLAAHTLLPGEPRGCCAGLVYCSDCTGVAGICRLRPREPNSPHNLSNPDTLPCGYNCGRAAALPNNKYPRSGVPGTRLCRSRPHRAARALSWTLAAAPETRARWAQAAGCDARGTARWGHPLHPPTPFPRRRRGQRRVTAPAAGDGVGRGSPSGAAG